MVLTQNKLLKIEDFTEGQIELLKALCQGCNIALYREGLIRLRDSKHNPLKNIMRDMFDKVEKYLIKIDGLYYIDEDIKQTLPLQIQKG